MFLPNRMSKANVLLFSKYLSAVTEAIGNSGIMHLIDAARQSEHQLLNALDTDKDIAAIEKALARCEVLMSAIGIDDDMAAPATVTKLSQDEIGELFEVIDHRYRECSAEVNKLLTEQTSLKNSEHSLEKLPFQRLKIQDLNSLTQLVVLAGKFKDAEALLRGRSTLDGEAMILRDGDDSLDALVLTTRRRRFAVEDTLTNLAFQKFELPQDLSAASIAGQCEMLQGKLATLQQAIDDARLEIVAIGEQYGGMLLAIRKQLRSLLAIRQAQGHFGHSSQLYCISGWLPTERLEELKCIVDSATDGTGVVEASEADNGDIAQQVPVQLSSNSLLRPFRMLVTNFGMPNYHELDPSCFVGLSFVVMFGYMFGDVGQGLVLLLTGLLMKFRRRNSEEVKDIGVMLGFCGISAMIFGLLYGSVFGYEELFHAVWVSPLHTKDIPQLLLTAIGIGIIFLSVSLLINIINHFRARKFFDGTFDKYGVLGLLFYWSCLLTAIMVVATHSVRPWQIVLILLPLVFLLLRLPILALIRSIQRRHAGKNAKKADEEEEEAGLFGMILEGAIETMETLTGYLSGTVSFVRVGAFAISHAALCMAVYTIMGMFADLPGGTALKLLIAILGNGFIIIFEGMVAAIQCVRLEYYEMFGRYFQGGGIPYKPFSIAEEKKEMCSK